MDKAKGNRRQGFSKLSDEEEDHIQALIAEEEEEYGEEVEVETVKKSAQTSGEIFIYVQKGTGNLSTLPWPC